MFSPECEWGGTSGSRCVDVFAVDVEERTLANTAPACIFEHLSQFVPATTCLDVVFHKSENKCEDVISSRPTSGKRLTQV